MLETKRKAVRRNVIAPRLDEDEALSRKFEGKLRGAFLRSVGVLRSAAKRWRFEVAASAWDPWTAVERLPWDEFKATLRPGLEAGIRAVFVRSLEKELRENFDLSVRLKKARQIPPTLSEQLTFEYLTQRGPEVAELVAGATAEGMTELLQGMVINGDPPAVIAKKILEQGLGLTPRWAKAVENLDERLGEAVLRGELSTAARGKKVAAYYQKLLKARARMIARTETIAARNAGIEASWNVAVSEGDLDPLMAKIWLAKVPCPICLELSNHDPVPMGKPFISPTIGPIMRPPAHPNCKCGIALVDKDRGLGPSARRLREVAQTDRTGLEVSRVAQEIQAEYLRSIGRGIER